MAPKHTHSKHSSSKNERTNPAGKNVKQGVGEKPLPYALVRAAAEELCALIETGDADDWVLDLAWIGLERPNPEPREDGKERLVVWMSRDESAALRALIDGDETSVQLTERAGRKIADALGGSKRTVERSEGRRGRTDVAPQRRFEITGA